MPRDRVKVASQVRDMRRLIEDEKPAQGAWDFKLMPGGLIDLEFIAQYAAITGQTGEGTAGTAMALAGLRMPNLSASDQQTLIAAHRLFSNLTQVLRLCVKDNSQSGDLIGGLANIICQVSGLPDLATLTGHIKNTAQQVRSIFVQLLR
jgi:[glutamine synthetase] adenylyltransferase / [glutamine synthetase]-adenylyl-L-tyrosine phosphorylase